jgi:hypothetical protein
MDSCHISPNSFTLPTNVFEAGTGAVRSADLVGARWDLISGAATRTLRDSSSLYYYNYPPVSLVNEAIDYGQRFLGCEHEGDDTYDNRISLLGEGWFRLAAAIQVLDATSDQLELLKTRVSSLGCDGRHYPYWALRRLAFTCDEGAKKYAEENWLHGFQVKSLMKHGIHHMIRWTNGFGIKVWGEKPKDKIPDIRGNFIDYEDELGHSMWSFMAATHMMLFRSSDMCEFLLGQNYTLTDEIKKMHQEHASRRNALK